MNLKDELKKEPERTAVACLLAVPVVLILIVLETLWRAFVLWKLYEWFFVSIGARPISMMTIAGSVMFFKLAFGREKSFSEAPDFLDELGDAVFRPLLYLGVGYLLTLVTH